VTTAVKCAVDAWLEVETALRDHFFEPDVEAARAFYAALAAHHLDGQPVWPMLVAPPGNMKTEMIKACAGLPNFHAIDSLTPNTFLSGRAPDGDKPRGKDGLLQRVGTDALIAFPDFSTLLEGNRDKRDQVFAQLRRLYDGELRREVGIELDADATQWKGRLTFIAGVTPEVDNYLSLFGQLGERFVMIRWARAGGSDAARCAMGQDISAKNAAMRKAVHGLFVAIKSAPRPEIPVPIFDAIAETAEIVARGRTPVKLDRDGNLEYMPQAEGATRIAQQLCQLAKGSARLDCRGFVNESDLELVHRVALDTIPPIRAAILRALAAGKAANDAELNGQRVPRTTLKRAVDALIVLGLIDGDTKRLTEEARRMFARSGLMRI
jgi:hypothetical protein